jgi:predicted ATP-grasp superfamily ATP-dependent carboligase
MKWNIKDQKAAEWLEVNQRKLLASKWQVVGVGLTAFGRISPGLVLPNYKMIGNRAGSDNEALRKWAEIKTLEEDFHTDIRRLNVWEILKNEKVQEYLASLGKVAIFNYKTSAHVEELCQEKGWKWLVNPHHLRAKFENKDEFFKIGRNLGLKMIEGEQLSIEQFLQMSYEDVVKRWGEKVVIQAADSMRGGGSGTYFVFSNDDLLKVRIGLKELVMQGEATKVNVTRFVIGVAASITGCVTQHGILTTLVQTQVIDVPELISFKGRKGVWRGHDWNFRQYGDAVNNQADQMAKQLGEYLKGLGYKGIFGVDLLVEDNTNEVYVVECNPRYTGAFPVYSFLQAKTGEIPLDAWQLLEMMDVEYDMDFPYMDQLWKQPKAGAHVVLHNLLKNDCWGKVNGDLTAGVYRIDGGQLVKVREGATPMEILANDEVVLTDGIPVKGGIIKPNFRCGKIIFGQGILENTHSQLNPWARGIVAKVYEGLKIEETEPLESFGGRHED